MSNTYVSLAVPAGNGVGAASDVSGLSVEKFVQVDGGAFDGSIVLEGSNDAGASFFPLNVGPFTSPTAVPQDFVEPVQQMRVRRTGSSGLGTPVVNVSGQAVSSNVFAAMNVPASDGVGTAVDLTSGGDVAAFSVSGPYTGKIFIETSLDGINFSPTLIFLDGSGTAAGQIVAGVLNSARVRRTGSTGGAAPAIAAGSGILYGGAGGGGGGVNSVTAGTAITITGTGTNPIVNNAGVTSLVAGPGISVNAATGAVTVTNTGVTSAVAGTGIGVSGATGAVTFTNTGVLGVTSGGTGISVGGTSQNPTVSNTGVTSLVAGTNISISASTGAVTISATGSTFPGFGGAPPQVNSASAAGVATTASRSDHTHAQDLSVVYAPSQAGGQASGVLTQTYAAPNATPTVVTVANTLIPFGNASGTLQTNAGLFTNITGTQTQIHLEGTQSGSIAFNATTTAGTANTIFWRLAGTNYITLQANPGTAGTANQMRLNITPLAGGDAEDAFQVFSSTSANVQFSTNINTGEMLGGSSAAIAAAGTAGYVWLPTMAAPPTGVPATTTAGARVATVIDPTSGVGRWYYYNPTGAAWHYVAFNDYSATATRIPFGGATAGTLTDSANFTFATANSQLTVGGSAVAAQQGAIKVNSNTANGFSIGGGQTAAIIVTDPFGVGSAIVAIDDYYFGQSLIGYSNGALTDLTVGVGGLNTLLTFAFAMNVNNNQTAAAQLDGNNGHMAFGDAIAGNPVMQTTVASGGNPGDLMLGYNGAALAANAVHGYPYMPQLNAIPTGAPVAYANASAFAFDQNDHLFMLRNQTGGQWEACPTFNSTAAPGSQNAAAFNNVPAGVASLTWKYWTFKTPGGTQTYVPYLQ